MSTKKKPIVKIEQPKTQSRAAQLHYLAQLRGEVEEERPKLNKKKFAIISLIVLAILAGILVYSTSLFNAIESANVDLKTNSPSLILFLGKGTDVALQGSSEVTADDLTKLNSWSSIMLLIRVIAIGGLVIYGLFAIITLLQPKRRKPNRSFWGDLGIYTLLTIIAVAMAFPLVFSIAMSLKPLDELFRFPPKVFPDHPTFDNFSDLIVTMGQSWVPFSRYLINTVFITFVGTFGHVLIASMAAFVLAKYDFPGGKTFFKIVVTALMFTGYVTGIPNFVIMSKIGIIDTYFAVILPAFAAPIGLFLMKQFMESLPNSLIEAAHLDGAGESRIFWSIVMPNVKPAWLTISIFSVQSLWNTNAATVIRTEAKKTLVYALQQIQAGGIARTGQAAAVTVVVMLVPITIFILFQGQIVETMSSSGLKD
jgi:ABC-type glycerol-3-phosphate transport system permease component